MSKRYVTLRHSTSSGNWCIEAPHPTVNVPQPHFIEGLRLTYPTLSTAVRAINGAGYAIVRNKKDGLRYLYDGLAPMVAA